MIRPISGMVMAETRISLPAGRASAWRKMSKPDRTERQMKATRRRALRLAVAAEALKKIGSAAHPALWDVVEGKRPHRKAEGIRPSWFRARLRAAEVLAEQGKAAVPRFAALLEDGDTVAKQVAAQILLSFGQDARPALQGLLKALRNRNKGLRASAAEVLCQLGPHEEPTVIALTEVLKDEYWVVRIRALRALGNVQPECVNRAVAALTQALAEEVDDVTRREAVRSLAKYASDVPEALVAIRRAVKDESNLVSQAAEEALNPFQSGDHEGE